MSCALSVPRAELAAGQHRRARGKDVFYRYHNQEKREGHSYRRQRRITAQHPDVRRIHNVINRFGQQRQGGGHRQADNGL
ncbi:hypothetical protein CE91St46_25180 [Eubacteriales bacterium]|nr:hypothetical protein CE91St46_25180 [Eubacteriales bacterium]GKH64126.1 hypothetical protein CE91St47_25950 [Eubacteriales bacterium]